MLQYEIIGLRYVLYFAKKDGVRRYQNTKGGVLLDVRTPDEYKQGHIPGSINIPVEKIERGPGTIKDRNMPIFFYCLRGSRSAKAVSALKRMGYTEVVNIGGIASYRGEVTRG